MSKLRILVCDDRKDAAVCDTVRSACADVELANLQSAELGAALKDFYEGVDKFLRADKRDESDLPKSRFDGFDVIIVDNNLAELNIPGARLTAEAILGALRAFTSSSYLLSLNKSPLVDFDLRFLIGDYSTRADLALNEEHLESGVLWGNEGEEGGFSPWYWPSLPHAAQRRRDQVAFVEANLDQEILKALEIPPEIALQLSARAVGFLDPAATIVDDVDGHPLEASTFWDHFRSSNRSLPLDDRAMVALGGVRDINEIRAEFRETRQATQGAAARRIAARIIAAELDVWARRDLLGPQDLLVDAPHLQALIAARSQGEGEDAWQATVNVAQGPYGFEPGLYENVLAPHHFAHPIWMPRPTFWWPPIEESAGLKEFRKAGQKDTTLAFAEDTRRFVRTTGEPSPWRFVPDSGKPWAPRFVERLAGYEYSPRSSFAR